jgi:cyclopropane fatty-acyl-phospholipid synthase-like methyltransferase
LRTGEPQSWHDFTAMSDAEMTEFFAGLHGAAVTTGGRIAATENFAAARHLLDVGGGSGGVAIGACQAAPALRATVLDLPRVIPFATSYTARAGLTDRIGICVADITCELPLGGFDLAVLRAVIQVLSPQDASAALRHVRQAMSPGGRVLIVGHVLDESRMAPPPVVGFNMVFLNVYRDAEAYTEGEHRTWLSEAGFTDIDIRLGTMAAGATLIVARKPA